jgi:hypothetical protein
MLPVTDVIPHDIAVFGEDRDDYYGDIGMESLIVRWPAPMRLSEYA